MPGPYHITRVSTSAATAINTPQAASNDVTGTASGNIVVPTDLTQNVIAAIYGSFVASTWTTTAVGTSFAVRATGPGIGGGQQDFSVLGLSSFTSTTGANQALMQYVIPLGLTGAAIAVIPGNNFAVSFSQAGGVSVGTWCGAVTFVLV